MQSVPKIEKQLFRGRCKSWTLDWTMDWTMDSILDSFF